MIAIDIHMPKGCYECHFAAHCNDCEGYSDGCRLDYNIPNFQEDAAGLTIYPRVRPEQCPLREVQHYHAEHLVSKEISNLYSEEQDLLMTLVQHQIAGKMMEGISRDELLPIEKREEKERELVRYWGDIYVVMPKK